MKETVKFGNKYTVNITTEKLKSRLFIYIKWLKSLFSLVSPEFVIHSISVADEAPLIIPN